MKTIVVLICLFCLGGLKAQVLDTVYHGKHFNSIRYYYKPDPRMMGINEEKPWYSLGNYKDSLKDGLWLYFSPEGKVYAKGQYDNGKKIGNWVFYQPYYNRSKSKLNTKKTQF
ncbi:MAG: hypothetical protein K0S33_340 [Bacteroidetes bacterium]|jgi:antitoxin component YwqK of YwqJK toxin-antitoxin module|nr:hypothetical protein [Bacteroidota bacterium]